MQHQKSKQSKKLQKEKGKQIMPRKILLFKRGAIGDVIMTTPLLSALSKAFPKAHIDYLVGNNSSPVLANNPHIHAIIPFDENIIFKAKIGSIIHLIRKIRKKGYDTIFILDRHWIFGLLGYLFAIPVRIGFNRGENEGRFHTLAIPFDGSKHEIEYYGDLFQGYLNLKGKDQLKSHFKKKTEIFTSISDKRFAKKIFEKYKLKKGSTIVIAPGGNVHPNKKGSLKMWSEKNFIALVNALQPKYDIMLMGDQNDLSRCDAICKTRIHLSKGKLINLCAKTSITQTAAIMDLSSIVICNDRGPMHIATTTSAKIISIFGPTDPRRFAPLDKKHKVFFRPGKCCPCNDLYGRYHTCLYRCVDHVQPKEIASFLLKNSIRHPQHKHLKNSLPYPKRCPKESILPVP